jgi:hypothetical protein
MDNTFTVKKFQAFRFSIGQVLRTGARFISRNEQTLAKKVKVAEV